MLLRDPFAVHGFGTRIRSDIANYNIFHSHLKSCECAYELVGVN